MVVGYGKGHYKSRPIAHWRIFSYLSFFIGCIISIALNFKDNSFLIDWIPWMLSGLVIASAVAYGTDIKLKKH